MLAMTKGRRTTKKHDEDEHKMADRHDVDEADENEAGESKADLQSNNSCRALTAIPQGILRHPKETSRIPKEILRNHHFYRPPAQFAKALDTSSLWRRPVPRHHRRGGTGTGSRETSAVVAHQLPQTMNPLSFMLLVL